MPWVNSVGAGVPTALRELATASCFGRRSAHPLSSHWRSSPIGVYCRMSRALDFKLGKTSFAAAIHKVDRSKIYGAIDIETLDTQGRECDLLTLGPDGKTLIPYGGTAFGYLSPDGEWCDSSSLRPVDAAGDEIERRPSNFDFENVLKDKATTRDLLDHNIRLAYQLQPVGGEFPPALLKKLTAGDIYRFPFSYRGGIGSDLGFMIMGADETVWLLIGTPAKIEMLSLKQAAGGGDADPDESGDGGGIDFEMF